MTEFSLDYWKINKLAYHNHKWSDWIRASKRTNGKRLENKIS